MKSQNITHLALSPRVIPQPWYEALKPHCLMTLGQLYDRLVQSPASVQGVIGCPAPEILAYLLERYPGLKKLNQLIQGGQGFHYPITGVSGPPRTQPALVERHAATMEQRGEIRSALQTLIREKQIPSRCFHCHRLPPVLDQGPYGYCVGFGATPPREHLAQNWMSPGWAYRGAKSLDGHPDQEGSWQAYAFEFFYKYGHVSSDLYSYEDAIHDRPLKPLMATASRWRIAGFIDLLLDEDPDLIPDLMRAVLAGKLNGAIGPRPLALSMALYDSFQSYTTRRTGLVTLPLPGERCEGGHAMSVVGYLNADDPKGLFDTDWFLVRNSWSCHWAHENPLNLPGHALIPADYFRRTDLIWELFLCLAEESPGAASRFSFQGW